MLWLHDKGQTDLSKVSEWYFTDGQFCWDSLGMNEVSGLGVLLRYLSPLV